MNRSVRNIVIFAVVTLGCGFLGHAINTFYQPVDAMQSLGVLIWLVSPLVTGLLLRWLGKDGWKDFGVRLHLKSGWPWYLAAFLITPILSLVLIGLGRLAGVTTTHIPGVPGSTVFFSLFATAFAGNMVKNIFEEFSWRGYLAPMLERVKLNPLICALVTGVIWAGWHIPYYLYFLSPTVLAEQTSLSVPFLILFAFIDLPMQAIVYHELRLVSKSVWTSWLLHTMANATSYALVSGGFILLSNSFSSTLLTPSTEGITYSLFMGLVGWGVHLYRMRST